MLHQTRLMLLGCLLPGLGLASASGQEPESQLDQLIQNELRLDQYSLQSITLPADGGAVMRIAIELEGDRGDLVLVRSSVRSPGFEVTTVDAPRPAPTRMWMCSTYSPSGAQARCATLSPPGGRPSRCAGPARRLRNLRTIKP